MASLALCIAGCGDNPAQEDTPAETSATNVVVSAEELMARAVDAIGHKDAVAATTAAEAALNMKPESAEASLLVGQAACLRQDYDQAVAAFSAVIKEKSLPDALRAKALAGRGVVSSFTDETWPHYLDAAVIIDDGYGTREYGWLRNETFKNGEGEDSRLGGQPMEILKFSATGK